jgi:hypothetical protein
MLVVYVMISIYRPRAEVLFKCLEENKDLFIIIIIFFNHLKLLRKLV